MCTGHTNVSDTVPWGTTRDIICFLIIALLRINCCCVYDLYDWVRSCPGNANGRASQKSEIHCLNLARSSNVLHVRSHLD